MTVQYAPIGSTYRTGQESPVNGDYMSVGHTDGSRCTATPEERMITLSKGENFPPHRSCQKGVIWQLVRIR